MRNEWAEKRDCYNIIKLNNDEITDSLFTVSLFLYLIFGMISKLLAPRRNLTIIVFYSKKKKVAVGYSKFNILSACCIHEASVMGKYLNEPVFTKAVCKGLTYGNAYKKSYKSSFYNNYMVLQYCLFFHDSVSCYASWMLIDTILTCIVYGKVGSFILYMNWHNMSNDCFSIIWI